MKNWLVTFRSEEVDRAWTSKGDSIAEAINNLRQENADFRKAMDINKSATLHVKVWTR